MGAYFILQYLIQALQGAVFSRVIYHPVHFRIQGKLSTTLVETLFMIAKQNRSEIKVKDPGVLETPGSFTFISDLFCFAIMKRV